MALEHAEGDERVEEVVDAPGVKLELSCDCLGAMGRGRQVGEESEFNGAEERLGTPERQAELQDRFRCDVFVHADTVRDDPSDSLSTSSARGSDERAERGARHLEFLHAAGVRLVGMPSFAEASRGGERGNE